VRKPERQTAAQRSLKRSELARTIPPISSPKLFREVRTASASRKRQRESQDTSGKLDRRAPKCARPDPTSRSRNIDGIDETDPIAYWAGKGRWPAQYKQDPFMEHILARKKSSSSLRSRKRSEPGSASSVREEKSAPYRDPRYKTLLETKGSFMDKSELGITDESKCLCRALLEEQQPTPEDSLFRDDIFEATCQKVEDRNEARLMRDITPLIVPSAEILVTYGAKELGCLIESTNEGWSNSIPVTSTRPQPDYSVGFRRQAFSDDRLEKLSPFVGNFIAGDQSFFMATYQMHFPFLTCEVKCGTAALDVADRQNAHSMTLAVRSVVELFRLVGREKEIDRQILAFSISHDHRLVRIYGHYAVVQGRDTKFYRHPIRTFDFTEMEGKDKWTAYCLTRNIYDIWMPAHFARICSAVDGLPSHLDFEVPSLPETGLSQELESHHLSQSDDSAREPDLQSSIADAQGSTPDTSCTEPVAAKRPRKKKG